MANRAKSELRLYGIINFNFLFLDIVNCFLDIFHKYDKRKKSRSTLKYKIRVVNSFVEVAV